MDRSPQRSPLLFRVARPWVRRQLGRGLDGLHVSGVGRTRRVLARYPVIFVANHAAWWDPLLALAVDECLGAEGYVLMDRENLCRIPILTRLGGVPVDRRSARPGLRTAAGLVDRPGRALWVYPQGRECPAHLRPLGFRRGISLLARQAPGETRIVPVGIQYVFRGGHHPAALLSLGPGIDAPSVAGAGGVVRLEAAVAEELHRIDRALRDGEDDFETMVRSRLPRPEKSRIARILDRILGGRTA